MWENSREFSIIGSKIAKNRKLIKESFEKLLGQGVKEATFNQAKKAMEDFIVQNLKDINDDKLKCVLRVA